MKEMKKRIAKASIYAAVLTLTALGTVFFWNLRHRGELPVFPGLKTTPQYVFTYADNQPDDYPTTQGAKNLHSWSLKERKEG